MSEFVQHVRALEARRQELLHRALEVSSDVLSERLCNQAEKLEEQLRVLEPLAEVAEAVERLEAENKELKRRVEALEAVLTPAPYCPSCGGTGRQTVGMTETGVITVGCPDCDGTGRVQA